MTPAQVAYCLGENALTLATYRARGLPLLSDLAQAARGFRLVSGDLDDAVRAVRKLTDDRFVP